ncbi:hypothetical protein K458DRAFT_9749 [Lentithecium fluviatile CBS 122367]|uniref:Uncharacterized protein n=1 Tax=Lentithecium fluviatile CBS 122367 TaxID=1168545 RepID=A0A6G1JPK3_9PLEO|nr:hypothetical protein K458DRAFT_9749 [Lentithecium fluviatile CBS 122367]
MPLRRSIMSDRRTCYSRKTPISQGSKFAVVLYSTSVVIDRPMTRSYVEMQRLPRAPGIRVLLPLILSCRSSIALRRKLETAFGSCKLKLFSQKIRLLSSIAIYDQRGVMCSCLSRIIANHAKCVAGDHFARIYSKPKFPLI